MHLAAAASVPLRTVCEWLRAAGHALARCSHTLLVVPLGGRLWRCPACELCFGDFTAWPPPASAPAAKCFDWLPSSHPARCAFCEIPCAREL